jgi:hypothetical protein
MSDSSARPHFLALPVELRLHIAADALEQQPGSGFSRVDPSPGEETRFELDTDYHSSHNLSIRLVCRQFNIDFTGLALQKTRFVLHNNAALVISTQPEPLLREVRKLVVRCDHNIIARWHEFVFNKDCLHLDELDLVTPLGNAAECNALVGMFRRLKQVKKVRLPLDRDVKLAKMGCYRLVGAMLKEDHYQRYDAPNAPNLGSSWWSWDFNKEFSWATFVAQEPKPIMAEQEYILLIKPKVDEIMEQTASILS